jgi:hypothetical protein
MKSEGEHFMKTAMLFAGILLAATLVCAQDSDTKPGTKQETPEAKSSDAAVGAIYKFDLTVEELQNERIVNSRNYSWTSELFDGKPRKDAINIGDRIPVVTGMIGEKGQQQEQFQYIDVGTNIEYKAFVAQDRVVVELEISLSSVVQVTQTAGHGQPVVRQTKTQTRAILSPGKPLTIFSLDDPGTPAHYLGKLTVTKM